jgi:molybdopterin-guanine dinucleotide biosynthesis protein A
MIKSDIHKIGYLLKNNNTKMIEFQNDDEFMNINNKEDYSNSLIFISKNNNSNK